MARLNVNPTRMELKKLKARLSTAVRGHKLLKDKSDEMIRRFSVLIRENKKLRDEVELLLGDSLRQFALARSLSGRSQIEKAFSMPSVSVAADYEITSVLGVDVPKITLESKSVDGLPYAYAEITSEADASVEKINLAIEKLIRLAELEKTVSLLAVEIERNKRRVNALEYVMIPQLNETIAYIRSKLEENERAATTRLMKVKSMIENR